MAPSELNPIAQKILAKAEAIKRHVALNERDRALEIEGAFEIYLREGVNKAHWFGLGFELGFDWDEMRLVRNTKYSEEQCEKILNLISE